MRLSGHWPYCEPEWVSSRVWWCRMSSAGPALSSALLCISCWKNNTDGAPAGSWKASQRWRSCLLETKSWSCAIAQATSASLRRRDWTTATHLGPGETASVRWSLPCCWANTECWHHPPRSWWWPSPASGEQRETRLKNRLSMSDRGRKLGRWPQRRRRGSPELLLGSRTSPAAPGRHGCWSLRWSVSRPWRECLPFWFPDHCPGPLSGPGRSSPERRHWKDERSVLIWLWLH